MSESRTTSSSSEAAPAAERSPTASLPPESASCCWSGVAGSRASRRTGSRQSVFVENRYVSPDTWYDASGKPFQPQVHYFVGGATKLYGAALYRLRREDFGELRHHDGISPAWPISYDELEPYYTQAEQLYQVHGARGEDPTEPDASGDYPHPAVSHEPRIQQLSDDLAARRLPPVPCAVRDPARRVEPALQHLRALRQLRRLPLRPPRQVRRRGDRRAPGARASERHPAHGRARGEAGDERRPAPRHRRRRRARRARWRRFAADLVVVSCGAANSAKLLLESASDAHPERPRERLRPGRAQLHVPRQPGRACPFARGEPDRLPEDPRAERLLLRERRLRVPARERPDGRQVPGADVPRREAGRDEARAAVVARPDRAACDRLLALDRGPAQPRQPRHGRRRRQGHAQLHGDELRGQEAALREGEVDPRGAGHEPGPPRPPLRLHEERDPRGRVRAPGRHLPFRGRSRPTRCSTPTAAPTRSTTSTSSTRASSRASAR